MKKGLLLGALLLGAGSISAQGLYVGLQGGYGFGTPGDKIGAETVITSTGDQTSTSIISSFGGGTNAGLNVGYMFTEHIGAELGFSYFLGSEVTSDHVTVPTGELLVTRKTTQTRLAPSIVLTTGGDFAVYTKAGLMLPVGGSTIIDYSDETNPLATVDRGFEAKGAMSIGFQGALGANYKLSDNLSIFGELSAVNLRVKSASNTMTRSVVAGTDVLSLMDQYDIETVFVDELTSSSNNAGYNASYKTTDAKEDLASTTNFNGFFINIGVKYNF